MKKQDYLDKLELELRRQNITKIDEILADYHEHFAVGQANGKSEEEIVAKLGEPTIVAKAYLAENLIQKIQDAPVQDQFTFFMRAVLRLIILTPINFVMLLGPVLLTFIFIVTMWSLVLSIGGFGIGLGVKVFGLLPFSTLGFWGVGATFFGTVAGLSICLLGIMVMFFVSKIILQMFVRYLQWNVEFIKGTTT